MEELWSRIEGCDGRYLVSNKGRVRSMIGKGKYLKPYDWNGYPTVTLRISGKNKKCRIHRLVAEAFIPNPDELFCVSHKDENKWNNDVNNLEWCTPAYNIHHSNSRSPQSWAVYCFDLDTCFTSASEASRKTRVNRTSITKACKNQILSAGGMWWCYAKDKDTKKWY